MKEILEFCGQNWRFLVTVLIAIAEILFLIFRTKKSRKTIVDSLLADLPSYILDAEEEFGHDGHQKLTYVLSCCIDKLEIETHESRSRLIRLYGDLLIKRIEAILDTPQKKGI